MKFTEIITKEFDELLEVKPSYVSSNKKVTKLLQEAVGNSPKVKVSFSRKRIDIEGDKEEYDEKGVWLIMDVEKPWDKKIMSTTIYIPTEKIRTIPQIIPLFAEEIHKAIEKARTKIEEVLK